MKKANAKERLLETASKLFYERGYSEVGINEIIEKADTAKASFYQHFKSKEGLCEAWLECVHDRSEDSRKEILKSDGCPVEKIDAYFAFLIEFIGGSGFRGCPYTNTATVVDTNSAGIRTQIEEHKISIRDFFRNLCQDFIPDEQRAAQLGDCLFILYSGATTEAQNLREIWPVECARKVAAELCQAEIKKSAV